MKSSLSFIFESDWNCKKLDNQVSIFFRNEEDYFYFGISPIEWGLTQADSQLNFPIKFPIRFIEGLWESSVAEIFIKPKNGENYVELHLAPDGSWWGCYFESYRKRSSQTFPIAGVSLVKEGQNLLLKIPAKYLADYLTGNFKIHLAAVCRDRENNKYYLSSSPVQGIEPDFHDQRCFTSPDILPHCHPEKA
jgi:hypothetical protein